MNILLTGATGFVGKEILNQLCENTEFNVRISIRHPLIIKNNIPTFIKDLTETEDWSSALDNIDCVIHSAARVHIMNETSSNPLSEFRKVNVEGTLNLARQAVAKGVKRFIFISSIKVNGEETQLGQPFQADIAPAPSDAYGISKYEAECGLFKLAKQTGLEVVVIRPVLVYGPDVKANFRSMLKWVNRGVPLPLGAIVNKRSLVSLDNLVDFVIVCIHHLKAANQVFLVSDGEDLSTSEILEKITIALGKKNKLIPVPVLWIKLVCFLLGKKNIVQRIFSSLQVDISKNKELLNWTPPYSVNQSMAKTAAAFLKKK